MQSFHFRLERILAWYRDLAAAEEARFKECRAALQRVQKAIAQCKAERLTVEQGVIRSARISSQDLSALSRYRLRARLREAELDAEKNVREKEVQEQRDRLIAVQRRVKLLEKLRERRAADHQYLAERELEAVAADAYTAKWVRGDARL